MTERCCSTCQDATTDRLLDPCRRCFSTPALPGWVPDLTEVRASATARRAAVAEANELNNLRAAINRGSEMLDAARRDGLSPDVIASYCVPPAQTGVWNVTQPPQPARGEAMEPKPSEDSVGAESSQGEADRAIATNRANDPVSYPAHYTQGAVECIDAIRAQLSSGAYEGFLRGQVAKYMWRMGRKGPSLEDARKALWYLERLKRELEAKP